MRVLVPINLAPRVYNITPVSEDPTPIWVSGTSYSVGQEVHRTQTHRVYRCAAATSGTVPPEQAITTWVDIRPTDQYAPFDYYTSTKSSNFTDWLFDLTGTGLDVAPGKPIDIHFRGVTGAESYVIVGAALPFGGETWSISGDMQQSVAPGWYEYLFLPPTDIRSLSIRTPGVVGTFYVKVQFINSSGTGIKVGTILLGAFENFGPDNIAWSCNRGSSVEPTTFSFIKTEDDGTVTIQRRASTTNVRLSSTFPIDYANSVAWRIEDLLDVPVLVSGGSEQQLEGLSTFGLISGSVSYDYTTATADISVKGLP